MKPKVKAAGARTQFFVHPDGTKEAIRVRSIDPKRESKYAKAAGQKTPPSPAKPAAANSSGGSTADAQPR